MMNRSAHGESAGSPVLQALSTLPRWVRSIRNTSTPSKVDEAKTCQPWLPRFLAILRVLRMYRGCCTNPAADLHGEWDPWASTLGPSIFFPHGFANC